MGTFEGPTHCFEVNGKECRCIGTECGLCFEKIESSDHAGMTRMIKALSGRVSCLPMLVESTSGKWRVKKLDEIEKKKIGRRKKMTGERKKIIIKVWLSVRVRTICSRKQEVEVKSCL